MHERPLACTKRKSAAGRQVAECHSRQQASRVPHVLSMITDSQKEMAAMAVSSSSRVIRVPCQATRLVILRAVTLQSASSPSLLVPCQLAGATIATCLS